MNTVTCFTCGLLASFNPKIDRWVHDYWKADHKVTAPPLTRSADRLEDGMAANDWADRERNAR